MGKMGRGTRERELHLSVLFLMVDCWRDGGRSREKLLTSSLPCPRTETAAPPQASIIFSPEASVR